MLRLKTIQDTVSIDEKSKSAQRLKTNFNYFKEEYKEQLLASSMILNDKIRLNYIRLNKESKAEEEANITYNMKTKK